MQQYRYLILGTLTCFDSSLLKENLRRISLLPFSASMTPAELSADKHHSSSTPYPISSWNTVQASLSTCVASDTHSACFHCCSAVTEYNGQGELCGEVTGSDPACICRSFSSWLRLLVLWRIYLYSEWLEILIFDWTRLVGGVASLTTVIVTKLSLATIT